MIKDEQGNKTTFFKENSIDFKKKSSDCRKLN